MAVKWRSDFDNENATFTSQWSGTQEKNSSNITLVSSPVRKGTKAAKILARTTDTNVVGSGSGIRAELALLGRTDFGIEGTTDYVTFSWMWDDTYVPVPNQEWNFIHQVHDDASGTQASAVFVYGSTGQVKWKIWGANGTVTEFVLIDGFQKGVWYDFILAYTWGKTAADGAVEAWVQQGTTVAHVVAHTACPTLYANTTGVYLKGGYYIAPGSTVDAVGYLDCESFGSNLADAQAEFPNWGAAAGGGGGTGTVTIDAKSSVTSPGTATVTLAHTVGPSADALYVAVSERFSDAVTVTYAGQPMTLVDSEVVSGNLAKAWLFELLSPPVGTANIVATVASSRRVVVEGISLIGVDQTTPRGAVAKNAAVSTSPSVAVASVAGGLTIDVLAARDDTNTITATVGGSQTQDVNLASSNGTSNGIRGGMSHEAGNDAGVTMSWGLSSSIDWAQLGVTIHPAPATVTNTAVPTVTGTAKVGQTLTGHAGTWTGTPTLTYQWQQDQGTGAWVDIGFANALTYVIPAALDGVKIRLVETADATTPAMSVATATVTFSAPVNSVAPAISGTTEVGSVLAVQAGAWSNSPTLTYQWKRGGVDIAGETGTTYTAQAADVGATITVLETATNDGGTASAASNGLSITAATGGGGGNLITNGTPRYASGALVRGSAVSHIRGGFARDASGAVVFGTVADSMWGGFLRDAAGALVENAGVGTMQNGFLRDVNGALITVSEANAVQPLSIRQGYLVDASGALVVG